MRSQHDDAPGVEPAILLRPADVASLAAAEEAVELADAYGVAGGCELDESQRFTLMVGLGERADGSWAASTMVDIEGRQNGKNDTCNARELAGLVLFGERLILHTAHEQPTATEAFRRMVEIFEANEELSRLVRHVYYANGAQSIEMRDGARLLYKTRTGSAGRGFAEADLVVYDEAQHLLAAQLAASAPTRLANPNSQSWYMGTGGFSISGPAWRLRRRALEAKSGRFGYVEHTAERVKIVDGRVLADPPADVLDRDAWAAANPAYRLGRISDENMLDLYEELGPTLFAQESLCVWDPEPTPAEMVIPGAEWHSCANPAAESSNAPVYAVEVDTDGYAAAIAASDGRLGVVLEWHRGTRWVRDKLAGILAETPGDVWGDPRGPAGALLGELAEAGIDCRHVGSGEYAQACQMLLSAIVDDQSFTHADQQVLNIAREQATRRARGDGWVWDRRRPNTSVSPLGAVTLAFFKARTARKVVLDVETVSVW